ncbi:MAG: Rid family detoxifying hydrolase [bacterium]|nr:Rid family detoxifying hydrolase [bacterium]
MKKRVATIYAPQATGPFSQALVVDNLVFTSGQICLTPQGVLLEGTIEEQIHQIMKNLKAILEEAGVSFSDVVKATIYVTDMDIYKTVNEVYGGYMAAPYPAREVVCVKALPLGAQVEISMVAVKA